MNDIHKAAAMLPQTPSPLFRLPGELRNEIFDLALTPSTPIVDPRWDTTIKPEHHQITSLGIALLRTCRAIYLEANDSVPLKKGDFVFTRVAYIQAFFSRLSLAQASHVRHISISKKRLQGTQRCIASRVQPSPTNGFITCAVPVEPTCWEPGAQSSALSDLIYHIYPVPWSLGLWFSPVFDKDESALVDLIGQTIRVSGEKEVTLIEWHTADGTTSLTVCVEKAEDVRPLTNVEVPLSRDGRMSWASFLEFKDNQVELTKRRKASLPTSDTIWDNVPAIQV
ncbi:hypothetical protein KCU67_g6478, partial [Aureobasidium melanogenum]